mgnify:FL=1|jgi:hypothetical protein|tara:strand:+ start:389 stop:616 length:228 start_codon:yes stop_codon:yes gene_type:complete
MFEIMAAFINIMIIYVSVGMCFALAHCFAMMYAVNFIDSEASDELTISAIIQQTFVWIFDWPRVIMELVDRFRDK